MYPSASHDMSLTGAELLEGSLEIVSHLVLHGKVLTLDLITNDAMVDYTALALLELTEASTMDESRKIFEAMLFQEITEAVKKKFFNTTDTYQWIFCDSMAAAFYEKHDYVPAEPLIRKSIFVRALEFITDEEVDLAIKTQAFELWHRHQSLIADLLHEESGAVTVPRPELLSFWTTPVLDPLPELKNEIVNWFDFLNVDLYPKDHRILPTL